MKLQRSETTSGRDARAILYAGTTGRKQNSVASNACRAIRNRKRTVHAKRLESTRLTLSLFPILSLSHSIYLSLFLYIYTLFSSPKVSNKKRKLRNDILKPTRNYLSSLLLSFSFPRRNRSVFQQVANVQTLFTLVLSVLSLNASHEMSGAPHIRAGSLN